MSKLIERYLRKDEKTYTDVVIRVAKFVASNEEEKKRKEYEEAFVHVMNEKDFIPNSPALMSAGTELPYMSACLVLEMEDSMESISHTETEIDLVTKYGAGVGVIYSNLRPEGDMVGSTEGVSSGPVSFIRKAESDIREVKQGGRRKGAMMSNLHVSHPDIMKFISCKGELDERNQKVYDGLKNTLSSQNLEILKRKLLEDQLINTNISVMVDKEFMKAVKQGEDYDLINPKNNKVVESIPARDIFDAIAEYSWKNGEPGMVFLDKVNEKHPLSEDIKGVNVCGEQPLLRYEQCVLGAVNLGNMVVDGRIDKSKIENTVFTAVRFLDNVIDLNNYPVPEIEEVAKKYRKIGVGVMGWAEMLIKLGIPYDSKEAIELAKEISEFINGRAITASTSIGAEKEIPIDLIKEKIHRRNAVVTTVAPTGSRAMLATTTGGIEPLFSTQYTHTDKDGNITQMEYDFVQNASDNVLRTALDIDPEWHIRMQAAWQEHIGASISKTINMPESATINDVRNAFTLAYDMDCKGLTVYRNKSRTIQVLDDISVGEEDRVDEDGIEKAQIVAPSRRFKMKTGCGTMYLIVVFDEDENIVEVFTETKNGGCKSSTEALSRINSLALRGGIPIERVIDQLLSVSPCVSYQVAKARGEEISPGASCPHALGLKLNGIVNGNPKETKQRDDPDNPCPKCGFDMVKSSGCVVCRKCGYSTC